MVGKKTHEQQLRIIEKREKTAGADKGFDAAGDLQKSTAERARQRPEPSGNRDGQGDDRAMTRGRNQESEHHKGRQR